MQIDWKFRGGSKESGIKNERVGKLNVIEIVISEQKRVNGWENIEKIEWDT
jgi:hypothetical protein